MWIVLCNYVWGCLCEIFSPQNTVNDRIWTRQVVCCNDVMKCAPLQPCGPIWRPFVHVSHLFPVTWCLQTHCPVVCSQSSRSEPNTLHEHAGQHTNDNAFLPHDANAKCNVCTGQLILCCTCDLRPNGKLLNLCLYVILWVMGRAVVLLKISK